MNPKCVGCGRDIPQSVLELCALCRIEGQDRLHRQELPMDVIRKARSDKQAVDVCVSKGKLIAPPSPSPSEY